ncbi:hypothetical protein Pla175_23250 [Pirellulimonas nuda]|uniref:H repeat-associated protein N-terminal domain-containing protein n=1 Tax=Pirellulimonas nuda TaxID=2528009 RepID=A0A518DBU1_9BACT|nr:ISAs1 family transposase [Pirellulimonas nuda]QDU88941.1 hypothetical protein Pla175_23250 [Pirellulimonas nuda]
MAARTVSMLECFFEVADPRSEKARVHSLSDILVLTVLVVIAGAEGWEDIEEFGKQQQAWLRRFLWLPGGAPSHDTISRVFRLLKLKAFKEGFGRWVESLHAGMGLKLVAIDGRTLRRSFDRRGHGGGRTTMKGGAALGVRVER